MGANGIMKMTTLVLYHNDKTLYKGRQYLRRCYRHLLHRRRPPNHKCRNDMRRQLTSRSTRLTGHTLIRQGTAVPTTPSASISTGHRPLALFTTPASMSTRAPLNPHRPLSKASCGYLQWARLEKPCTICVQHSRPVRIHLQHWPCMHSCPCLPHV